MARGPHKKLPRKGLLQSLGALMLLLCCVAPTYFIIQSSLHSSTEQRAERLLSTLGEAPPFPEGVYYNPNAFRRYDVTSQHPEPGVVKFFPEAHSIKVCVKLML